MTHIVINRLHTFSFFTWLVFEFLFFFPSSFLLAAAMPAVFLRPFCVSFSGDRFIIAPLGSFHLIALACSWRLFGSGINPPHTEGAAHAMTRMQETTLYLAAFFFFFGGLGQKICFSKTGDPLQANHCRIPGLNFDENADYRRKKDDTPIGLHLSTSGHEADGVVSRLSTLLPFEAQTI